MTRCRIGCAVAALLLAMPAAATTIVRVADEALVEQAPLVVVARVVEKGPAAARTPSTEYRFAVEQVLKGAVGPELTVRVPGGVGADGIGLRISGAPSFAPGERTILFLESRAGGDYRILHLMQGAFREVRRDGHALALRDLADVNEMRVDGGRIDSSPADAAEPARDFAAFSRWIADSARGAAPAADYRVSLPAGSESPGRIAAPINLFSDGQSGHNLRWFEFDTGGAIDWHFGTGGQPAVPGSGLNAFKTALNAWNADRQTPIRYRFAGTSGASGGLCGRDNCGFDGYDELNVILFGDPNDELSNLSGCSGTLAYGGPWYGDDTGTFRGQEYHRILNADIVINDGLECFFNGSSNAAKAAEQLFAHELGHTLGLDHPCGNPGGPDSTCSNPTFNDALMRAIVHLDDRGARLNSDDLAAARSLYKPGGGNSSPAGPPAAPTRLTATPFSTTEIDLAWQDNSNDETGFIVEIRTLTGAFVELNPLDPNTTAAEVFGLSPSTAYVFRVRARNAQGKSAPSNEVQASTNAVPGACVPGAQTLCLAGGRFRVDVDWATDQGTSGKGQVVPGVASDDSGLFYFFGPSNWELVVKVLDACPVNQRFWVFAGGLTNVQTVVRVIDTPTGAVQHYFNPQSTPFQPVQDTGAFATCSSSSAF